MLDGASACSRALARLNHLACSCLQSQEGSHALQNLHRDWKETSLVDTCIAGCVGRKRAWSCRTCFCPAADLCLRKNITPATSASKELSCCPAFEYSGVHAVLCEERVVRLSWWPSLAGCRLAPDEVTPREGDSSRPALDLGWLRPLRQAQVQTLNFSGNTPERWYLGLGRLQHCTSDELLSFISQEHLMQCCAQVLSRGLPNEDAWQAMEACC